MYDLIPFGFGNQKDFYLLLALVHDFGKSIELCTEESMPTIFKHRTVYDEEDEENFGKKLFHEYASYAYCKRIARYFLNIDQIGGYGHFMMNQVAFAVLTHHNRQEDEMYTFRVELPNSIPKEKRAKAEADAKIIINRMIDALNEADLKQREYEAENLEEILEEFPLKDRWDLGEKKEKETDKENEPEETKEKIEEDFSNFENFF